MAISLLVGYLLLRGISAWVVGVYGMRDAGARQHLELLPLRDAFAFIVWIASFFPQRIHWRGREFHVRDKRLVPTAPRE